MLLNSRNSSERAGRRGYSSSDLPPPQSSSTETEYRAGGSQGGSTAPRLPSQVEKGREQTWSQTGQNHRNCPTLKTGD